MPKCRVAFADALARLLFDKPLADLDRSERAELNFLRALDADAAGSLRRTRQRILREQREDDALMVVILPR